MLATLLLAFSEWQAHIQMVNPAEELNFTGFSQPDFNRMNFTVNYVHKLGAVRLRAASGCALLGALRRQHGGVGRIQVLKADGRLACSPTTDGPREAAVFEQMHSGMILFTNTAFCWPRVN